MFIIKALRKHLDYNTSSVGIYNQMKRVPGTSVYEVKRTLEAIQVLNKYPRLLREVIRVTEKEQDSLWP